MIIINISDLVNQEVEGSSLELVKLGGDQIPMIPFTLSGVRVALHYCRETEVQGYIHCNGGGCILCKIGRNPTEKVLLPVFLPVSLTIGVLSASTSLRPRSLLPQLAAIQKADNRVGVFISKEDNYRFKVDTFELKEGIDTGEKQISEFLERYEAGEVDLTSVYPRLENEQLAAIDEIARVLQMKGYESDDGNQAA